MKKSAGEGCHRHSTGSDLHPFPAGLQLRPPFQEAPAVASNVLERSEDPGGRAQGTVPEQAARGDEGLGRRWSGEPTPIRVDRPGALGPGWDLPPAAA